MEFNDDVALDTSQVQDTRGSGGGGIGGRVALGGGGVGIIGAILYFVLSQLGGLPAGSGGSPLGLDDVQSGQSVSSADLSQECRTGADANAKEDCALVAVINSIQGYWTDQFARSGSKYQLATTNFFTGGVRTGCGSATSDVGPFYCPADAEVYIDLAFFKELETRFGAQGGTFAEAYVLAHEYGHHVQNLLGTSAKVREGTGPTSDGVRLELQADCYAGVWANHATTVPTSSGQPLIKSITQDDINRALDVAARIGDDYIQKNLGGGRVDESQFSHGSSAQREKWFSTGYQTGNPTSCDTFAARNLG
ncbi:neutral zinc metallopeptidase [Actinokineospora sp. PR83]|uniref:KPN_02809 family neutral zinc metallopeptidase n=1 Tax=Actinokineospora sp. PR83 TaxID=2884908 RepID=UPI0027DFEE90|nr:neutral zinc metallopeptidase [Actinokineospora sp. PR83]MCG8914835.1 neutral zinc metallopeptidase [Actinokineospora sp. PR83]